jgi:ABC-2 type transport system ATP-binding protein
MPGSIDIRNVSKRFRMFHDRPKSFKEKFIKFGRQTHEDFWALTDVTLDVKEGETVGLLGHNGSGKSTLLKCVSGVMRPTTGSIHKQGRTAALLELGSGFHPELTGRENIFLNGSIVGLKRTDIERIFDDVVDFAEIGPFIDNQVKHYSSGMYARLAFALAVNVEPEVMLIDEVLAVGDESFQKKCLDRIKDFQKEGRTILVVTHNADLTRKICDRVAVLDQGKLIAFGSPSDSVIAFRDALVQRGIDLASAGFDGRAIGITMAVQLTDVEIVLPDPNRSYIVADEPVKVRIAYHAPNRVEDAVFSLNVEDQLGTHVLGVNTTILGIPPITLEGDGVVEFDIERVSLQEGLFNVAIGVHNLAGVDYDHRSGQDRFEVMNSSEVIGLVHCPVTVAIRPGVDMAAGPGPRKPWS